MKNVSIESMTNSKSTVLIAQLMHGSLDKSLNQGFVMQSTSNTMCTWAIMKFGLRLLLFQSIFTKLKKISSAELLDQRTTHMVFYPNIRSNPKFGYKKFGKAKLDGMTN